MLDASPLKNSYIGKIIHDRYQSHLQQPDGTLTLSSILNETLQMLKGRQPNRPLLTPIPCPITPTPDPSDPSISRYNNTLRLHDSLTKESLTHPFKLSMV